jgi:hypothetical protein
MAQSVEAGWPSNELRGAIPFTLVATIRFRDRALIGNGQTVSSRTGSHRCRSDRDAVDLQITPAECVGTD